jgi:nitrite reductase/ring-hydroxylating ferredoxin subunit
MQEVTAICRVDELPASGGREFTLRRAGEEVHVFLLRQGAAVLAFHNVCPHQGRALSYASDQFLFSSPECLVCPHHGATFSLPGGQCIEGPCKGDRLQPVAIRIEGDTVLLPPGWVPAAQGI